MVAYDPNRFVLEQITYLKLAFLRVLRVVFTDESIPPQYRYSPDREKRQLAIFTAWPERTEKLPYLIIDSESANVSIQQLGQEIVAREYVEENGHDVHMADIYGGVMFVPIKIEIAAQSTTDRDIITDIVSGYIRYAARSLFQANGLNYLDIQAGSDGEEGEGANTVFKGKVEVKCQTEFRQRIDLSLYEKIQSINLKELRFVVDGEE